MITSSRRSFENLGDVFYHFLVDTLGFSEMFAGIFILALTAAVACLLGYGMWKYGREK